MDRDHGDQDLWAYVEMERGARESQIDPRTGLNQLQTLRKNILSQNRYTPGEVDALVVIQLLSKDLAKRGVARRLVFDSPQELRQALSLEARIRWANRSGFGNSIGGGNCSPEAWTILRALAVGDTAVASRFFEVNDEPIRRGQREEILLYNALLAIVTKNADLQATLRGSLDEQRGAATYRAMFTTLAGIIKSDGKLVSAGLDQVLATFRRIPYLFEEEKIISFIAHGLAQLALEKDRGLLHDFDCERRLPWDSGFFHWLDNELQPPVIRGLTNRSELASRWLNDLEIPNWWKPRVSE
jgi:hypothetical protein